MEIIAVALGIMVVLAIPALAVLELRGLNRNKEIRRNFVHVPPDASKASLATSQSRVIPSGQEHGCPSGAYAQWPIVAFWALLILGSIGAAAGSGGSPAGFLAALVLNPILWAAIYVFRKIGSIRCPHCRKSSPIGDAAKYPVGSAITCSNCGNDFAKPVG